jgi:TetR/AcrR family transcriptional regulator, transcriptional repressor for nem operon
MMADSKANTRAALLKSGRRIIVEKGYNHTGIQEVLQEVGVPKGSFYHFFSSKEDFGLEIINYDARLHEQVVEQYLGDTTLSPLNRIRQYFEDKLKEFQSLKYREGCLFGNLSQEMADQNERFRNRLQEVLSQWRDRFAQCLEEAQAAGEISAHWDAHELAEYCLNSWEGALLQMKVTKSEKPLQAFIKVTFETVLKP